MVLRGKSITLRIENRKVQPRWLYLKHANSMIRLYSFRRKHDGTLLKGSMLKTSLFDLIAYVPIILFLGVDFLSLAEPIAPDAVLHPKVIILILFKQMEKCLVIFSEGESVSFLGRGAKYHLLKKLRPSWMRLFTVDPKEPAPKADVRIWRA